MSDHDLDEFIAAHRARPADLTWDDYIGNPQARRMAEAVIWGVTHRDELGAVGVATPRGMLILGEPGSGKTYLARVMASLMQAADPSIAFLEINASELTAAMVRDLSRELPARARLTVVFVDEADLFIVDRNQGSHTDESLATLVAVLAAMDGLTAHEGILWIFAGATEHFTVDNAIRRPGRASYVVRLQPPTLSELERMLRYYLAPLAVDPAVEISSVIELLGGARPARIAQVVSQALLFSMDEGVPAITTEHLMLAITSGRDRYGADRATLETIIQYAAYAAAGRAVIGARLGILPSSVVVGAGGAKVDFESGLREVALADSILRDLAVIGIAASVTQRLILGDALHGADNGAGEMLATATQSRMLSGLVTSMPLYLIGSSNYERTSAENDLWYRTMEAEYAEAERRAETIILAERSAVVGLAERLKEVRTLSGDALEAVLDEFVPGRPTARVPIVRLGREA